MKLTKHATTLALLLLGVPIIVSATLLSLKVMVLVITVSINGTEAEIGSTFFGKSLIIYWRGREILHLPQSEGLSCTSIYQCQNPEIVSVAKKLGCDIVALHNFVASLPYVPSAVQHYPNETMGVGGDCDDKAFLLASLLRACDVPAYVISGLVVVDQYGIVETGNTTFVIEGLVPHAWVQYYERASRSWEVLDPTLGGKTIYIPLTYYAGNETLLRTIKGKTTLLFTFHKTESISLTLLLYFIPFLPSAVYVTKLLLWAHKTNDKRQKH